MRLQALFAITLAQSVLGQYDQEDIDSGQVLRELSNEAYENAIARLDSSSGDCTPDNVRVRKEWRTIPEEERASYVEAIECLMDTTSLNPSIEGARSLFDDFGVLHRDLSNFVHFSASFFLFHRHYIWIFEEALRNECGYEGTFPYWNWGEDAEDLEASPLFDGSASSMGNNGAPESGGGGFFPGGTGGGCLMEGPFMNASVNLGGTRGGGTEYNPRCLRRDLNSQSIMQWASLRNSTTAILDSPDIELFQAIVQGDSRYPEGRAQGLGVHGGGHFAIGGDPGSDFNWSPLEPAFYHHHAQIDRLYFIWQNLDWENRQEISGTATMNNRPPSDEQTLDDVLDMEPLGEPRPLGDLLDTVGGSPFCFVYE